MLLEAALSFGRAGWLVLPLHSPQRRGCSCGDSTCQSPAKHPRIRNGLRGASSDLDQIEEWWSKWPGANIGIRTGDHFDVLDVDNSDGAASLALLVAENGPLPEGAKVTTGGGGLHILFAPTGAGNRAGIRHHIDWRGEGGYIVAPPSIHASGERYRWIVDPDRGEIPGAPAWLRLLVIPPPATRATRPQEPLKPLSGTDGTQYGEKALTAEIQALGVSPIGMRNHNLNTATFNLFQLVGGGELSEVAALNALTSTALAIGLGELETRNTIASGMKAGLGSPRTAPPLRLVAGGAVPLSQPPGPSPGSVPIEPAQIVEHKPSLSLRWVHEVFDSPPPEPSVLIDGMLRRGELCVLGAARAVGKSIFAMNLATLLGRGEGLLGGTLKIRHRCKVLYAQGELGEWESFDRWWRMAGSEGPPLGVAETFDRWRLRVVRRRLNQTGQAAGFSESQDFLDAVLDGRVEETVATHGIDVLIIDPWAVYFAGSENSNDEVEAGLDKLRDLSLRYGLSVVVMHHIGKANEMREPEDLWRGASRLADWASTRMTLQPLYNKTEAQALQYTRQQARAFVQVTMLRRGAPTPDFAMWLDNRRGWWERTEKQNPDGAAADLIEQ